MAKLLAKEQFEPAVLNQDSLVIESRKYGIIGNSAKAIETEEFYDWAMMYATRHGIPEYNKDWRAWDSLPTEDEMQEAKWVTK